MIDVLYAWIIKKIARLFKYGAPGRIIPGILPSTLWARGMKRYDPV
ncbi:MAG: hypothetical protein OEY89_18755 [Gammaproteobacteria bacterium]|nr:hypothetical protein [Gammaproteobacteria bacterium]